MNAIDRVKASKAKATRQRDNWKARALALESELNAYKAWAAKVNKWHTELCEMCGIPPVNPANNSLSGPATASGVGYAGGVGSGRIESKGE